MTEETKPDDTQLLEEIGDYKYGFHDRDDNYVFKSERGLSREVVENAGVDLESVHLRNVLRRRRGRQPSQGHHHHHCFHLPSPSRPASADVHTSLLPRTTLKALTA